MTSRQGRAARLDVEAHAAAGDELGRWLQATMRDELGIADDEVCAQLELAVHEIWVNIVEHAYRDAGGPVTITAARRGDQIVFELFDHGRDFDPRSVPEPRPERAQVRGFGLSIVRSLMDQIVYEHTADGNRWQLTRQLESA